MRVIDRFDTAWSPYAVTFSHDGTRLAIAGGGWYGDGAIALIDLRTRARVELGLHELAPGAATAARLSAPFARQAISALAFSADDRSLFAATWSSSHRNGAALAFDVDELRLRLRGARPARHALTGIALDGAGAVARRWREQADRSIETLHWPDIAPPARGRPVLTGHRLVLAHGHAITGNHGAHAGPAPTPPLRPGVIVHALDRDAHAFVEGGTAHVTAIGGDGAMLITGHADGSLAAWRWDGDRPALDRPIGSVTMPRPPDDDAILWALYQPSAIVGICTLADGRHAAVSAGGALATWSRDGDLASWSIPQPGTARALAASPDRAWVAVGLKLNRRRQASSVVLVEVAPEQLAASATTIRTCAAARAAAEQRAADGTLDRTILGVLADALEETGASPALLDHLRTHDPGLRTCWIVDALLASS